MKIIIVEDDHLQADWIRTKLEQAIPGAEVEHLSTELEFRSHLDAISKDPPQVIILDVMLRWADPSSDLELPSEEIRQEGFYRAGLRCEKLLAQNKKTSHIPVILYTVLERTDLEPVLRSLRQNVEYLPKESDPSHLIARILELTHQR